MQELWSGQPHKTLTQRAGEGVAYTLGATRTQAETTGIVLDVAVPLAAAGAVGAARVVSIRGGCIALAEHEGATMGHTILKHVGKTEAELRARLLAEPRIPVAGSFSSLRVAKDAVSEAMRKNAPAIKAWAAAASKFQKFELTHTASRDIGYGVVRVTGKLQQMRKVRVVLKAQQVNGKLYFIITSYPLP